MSLKSRIISRSISVFEYIVSGYMILAGLVTTITPGDPTVQGAMQAIYTSRIALVIIGLIIAGAGLALLVGKIKKDRKLHGRGLWLIYCCFLFAGSLRMDAVATKTISSG